MNKGLISIVLFIIVFISSCVSHKDNTIHVSCNLPLTGYIGYYGERVKNGLELARKELQEEMLTEKINFTFDYQDNKGETKEVITILNKQKLDSPDIYMSGITTQTMAIIDQVKKLNIIHMLWSWTPLDLKEGDKNFRCWVNFGIEAQNLIQYIKPHKPQKIAYIHVNNIGSKIQCQDIILPALKKENPSIQTFTEEYPAETTNFKNIIAKIKEFNPEIIVISGYKDNLMNIIKDIDVYKIDRKKVICSMDLLEAIDEVPNEILEGLHVTAPAFNIPELHNDFTKQWIKKFETKNNRRPVYTEAYGYDCMLTIYEAAKIAKLKNQPLDKSLYEVDIEGVTGHLSYRSNGEVENNMHIGVFKNGTLVLE